MSRKIRIAAWALCLALAVTAAAWAAATSEAGDISTAPPEAPFRKVSELVPLPDFIPGMGTLYVDPATLPVGPFLGYDRQGKLAHVTFMIPLADLTSLKNFTRLGEVANWLPVDHVDVTYNPGHPGVAEPHYHITLWTVPHEDEAALN